MTISLYLWTVGGVVTSILLPALAQSVRDEFRSAVPASKSEGRLVRLARAVWPYVRKYLKLMIFSLLTALLLVAALGETISSWAAAFLAGYAWDSTVQKLLKGV